MKSGLSDIYALALSFFLHHGMNLFMLSLCRIVIGQDTFPTT